MSTAQRILKIDLTKARTEIEEIGEDVARKYIGGSGLAAKILYELTSADTHPLGPENALIFMAGPFTGTRIPTSGRHAVVARSPLTGIWGEADVGGTWGTELKRTGYDGIIITGKADKMVYLWIKNEEVQLRDAEHLRGKDTYEVDEILRRETSPSAKISSIGIAGENMVRIASIMTDGIHARAAGRCGLGAVMGSKNLKGIAVYGSHSPQVRHDSKLRESVKKIISPLVKNSEGLRKFGTSGGMMAIDELGDLSIKNWQEASWKEGATRLSGQSMEKSILTGRYRCAACPIGCGRIVEVPSGPYALKGAGPEYETLACLGALTLVDNLEAIAKAAELCNRYGMDTISTGGIVAFAMELYEKRILNERNTDGMKLPWGKPQVLIDLIHVIAHKQGQLGEVLAEGVRKAAQLIGGLAEEYAIHVKGLELPAHDPRAYNSVGLGYATSNRGACHLQGATHWVEVDTPVPELGYDRVQDRFGVDNKGELVAKMQDLMCMFDALKACKFILGGGVRIRDLVEWLNYVTDWNMDSAEFMKTGARLFNLKRMFNVRLGISRKDDNLPGRILTVEKGGGAEENLPPLGKMLSRYYQYRRWSEAGIPTAELLSELELDNLD